MRKLLIILTLLGSINFASAQDNRESADDIINEILEYAAESGDDNSLALSQITSEYLENLTLNKLNINACSFSDLQQIPFLTDYQIDEILNYRLQWGQYVHLGELKAMKTLTLKELKFLQFFLYVGPKPNANVYKYKLFTSKGKHSLTTTTKFMFERQRGYLSDSTRDRAYLGNPLAWCIKYRYTNSDKIAFGFTADKDAGESLSFGDKKYGFDFNSFFIKLQNYGKIDKLVIGDYIAKFGEGLMFGGGFSMGKFISSANYAATENIVREYTSANENWFYRGAALSMHFHKFKFTAFINRRKLDATSTETSFSTFKTDGYHRTERELATKDAVSQDIASLILSYRYKSLKIEFATEYYKFDKSYVPKNEERFLFACHDKQGVAYSMNYGYSKRHYCFHGETALDKNFNLATINTLELKPINLLKFSLLYRNFSKEYQSFTAQTFCENSKVSNEEGFYLGAAIEPGAHFVIESWIDFFHSPWLNYRSTSESSGYDFLTQATFIFSSCFNIQLRYKSKEKDNSILNDKTTHTQYFRFTSKYSPTTLLTLTSVAQWSFYDDRKKHDKGYLVYENVQFKTQKLPFSFAIRYALFSAPYSARIYAYENDVMYFFSVPAYYYKGCRFYVLTGYKFNRHITLQFRLSRWKYFDRQKLSSGNSLINDNKKTELNMYFRITF